MRKNLLVGTWKLVEVDDWDEDEIDKFEPAMFEIRKGGDGSFNFLALNAVMDWDTDEPGDYGRIEFSWMGHDDGTEVFGRGWAAADGAELLGEIMIFKGDRHRFRAADHDMGKGSKEF